jgi:glycosyltransferase involved in cell wall biosynthesis
MKVALVHDWITGMRGGERCLEAFLDIYPEADIFTLVHIPGTTTARIDSRVKATSFLNRIPGIARLYRALLPLFPLAARSLRLDGYDLVISLSHAAAKNVRVPQGVSHICYCFTPMRYIWDQAPAYFRGLSLYLVQPILWPLRAWDRRGAKRVTEFVAISSFIAARIRRFYGRRALVIPPPVRSALEIERALTQDELALLHKCQEPFFLCAGALVPYKRIDVAIAACNSLGVPLWVIGKGPELEALKGQAGPTVKFFGHVSEGFLWESYRRCRALLFPGIEDFGIVPVECLASGRPVIAVQAGGVAETVQGVPVGTPQEALPARVSGVFVPKSGFGSSAALAQAIRYFTTIEGRFQAQHMLENAQQFESASFFRTWRRFADRVKIPTGVSPAGRGAEMHEARSSKAGVAVGES